MFRPQQNRGRARGLHLFAVPRIREKAQCAGLGVRQGCDARHPQAGLAAQPEPESHR